MRCQRRDRCEQAPPAWFDCQSASRRLLRLRPPPQPVLDLFDALFAEIGQGCGRFNAQGLLLRGAPARQPVGHLGLVAFLRGRIGVGVQQRRGQIVLARLFFVFLQRIRNSLFKGHASACLVGIRESTFAQR